MTRAAIYLRISQDKTGEQAGVTRQREDCLALVKQQDWTLADVYQDNDISASSGKVRPDYRRLLADIEAGLIDAIVCWHPDRLYRKLADLEGLIAAIERQSVIMRTVRAGEIDLSTPTGRMLARILSATAQAEGEVKADRWRRSWQQGREQGKWAGSGTRLFGYTREGEVIPDEAAVAQEMAKRIAAGEPIMGVARWLEAEGIKGTRGGVWTPIAVKQYLTRPIIAGYATLHGEIVREGDWEPVVDRETWEEARALLGTRTRQYVPRVSLLNGLIFCGECSARMITGSNKGTRTYRCSNRPGHNGCGGSSGNAPPIEAVVESFAQTRLADPRVRQQIAAMRAEPSNVTAEIADLELRITELEASLDQPGVPVATILRAVERAKAHQADLMGQLASRNHEPLPHGDDWPTDLRRRRALVDLVVERVDLAKATRPSRLGFDNERVSITPRG